jgi:hypothetical protein
VKLEKKKFFFATSGLKLSSDAAEVARSLELFGFDPTEVGKKKFFLRDFWLET